MKETETKTGPKKTRSFWRSFPRSFLRPFLRAAAALLLAGGLLLLLRSLVNGMFLKGYENGNYAEYPEKLLLPLRAGDDDIVSYNLGDAAYRREEYETAARYFASALERIPGEGRDCGVRINLALSTLHAFPFDTLDTGDAEQRDRALRTLYAARSVLTENGCAEENADSFNGHSREAEKLKQDIDEMIRKLLSPPPEGQDGSGGDRDAPGEGSGENRDGGQDEKDGEAAPRDTDEGGGENRQRELQEQLRDQKRELDTESYNSGGSSDFTYIDTGDTVGFGEGVPW